MSEFIPHLLCPRCGKMHVAEKSGDVTESVCRACRGADQAPRPSQGKQVKAASKRQKKVSP